MIKSSTGAISIDTNGQSVAFGTALASTNTGGLTKNGAGTLALNAANLDTGTTTINGGTVILGNATAMNGNALVLNSGTLNVNGQGTTGLALGNQGFPQQTIGILSGGTGAVITNGGPTSQLTITENQSSTFAGSFTTGTGGLYVTAYPNAGTNNTLTLSGSSTVDGWSTDMASDPAGNLTVLLTGTLNVVNGGGVDTARDNDATFIVSGGLLNSTGNFLVGHSGSVSQADTTFILNSGTVTAGTVQKWRGSNTGGVYLNGGVFETGQFMNVGNPSFTSLVGDDGVMNVVLNGGTIENTLNGGILFEDGVTAGYATRYDVNVEIGSGATINTNGLTTTSQRPFLDVTGSSSAGLLTINGGGTMILTGPGVSTERRSSMAGRR